MSWEFLVESVAPDGRNMIHLIAAGWNHLRDRDLTEATSFAKALASRMTVAQLHASTSADGGGTCLRARRGGGANTRNLLKYVLDRGGREMLEMTNARGETPVQCARVALEALKAEDEAAGRETGEDLTPAVTEGSAEVEDIKRRLMAKFHRKKQGLASCIEELELAAKASGGGAVSSPSAATGRSERRKQPAAQKPARARAGAGAEPRRRGRRGGCRRRGSRLGRRGGVARGVVIEARCRTNVPEPIDRSVRAINGRFR